MVEHAQVVDAPALGETKPPTLEQPAHRYAGPKAPARTTEGLRVHAEPVFNGRGRSTKTRSRSSQRSKGSLAAAALTLEYLFSEPVSVDAVYTVNVKALHISAGRRSRRRRLITASLKSPIPVYDSTVMRTLASS